MTRFRPCIDLHAGQVKQIVGGSLSTNEADLKTNYVSKLPSRHYAGLYKSYKLYGAHIIMLGPGNEDAAKEALHEWPGHLQIGGGITDVNAMKWISEGAEKVIVTSYLFPDSQLSMERLRSLVSTLGKETNKLVIDLSCRRKGSKWYVATNKWQTITEFEVNQANIKLLEEFCSEFLIHAADNEGLQQGIDEDLVRHLSEWCSLPVTYAGGGKSLGDLDSVKALSQGRVDLTIGSALDVFGGHGVKFDECVNWNKQQ